jgi:hypothetical protein
MSGIAMEHIYIIQSKSRQLLIINFKKGKK